MTDESLAAMRRDVKATAVLLGERLDTRGMEQAGALAAWPIVIPAGAGGRAVVFRYGAVVLFAMSPAEEAAFLEGIAARVAEPLLPQQQDTLRIIVGSDVEEQIDASGVLLLREFKVQHMQLIAEALAKSLVLSHFEAAVSATFDSIEPLAARLKHRGRTTPRSETLLRHLGEVLLTQQRMVGRVAIAERPDVLWDHPRLERLYARLEDWYELIDRDKALDRKLEVISRTAETLNDLLSHRRSLRVEWYIVLLILFEIFLTLYQMVIGLHP